MLSKLVKFILSVFLIFFAFQQAKSSPVNKFSGAIVDSETVKKTVVIDSLPKKSDKGKLKSKIKYTAKDSIRFEVMEQKVYLYGDAKVSYEDINLQADYVVIDWTDQSVLATGTKDSLGRPKGLPEFAQGSQKFKSSSMRYNFETKKGKINSVTTSEGGGFIHGEAVKKDSNNNFYIYNGDYTTCDADTPHYRISAKKLQVVQNDKIVTGPAVLEIEGITTPLFLPFGFFPHKAGRNSGILIPAYGESVNQGFNLRNGGYYFGINDNVDLALRGDIYTKGSWAANATTHYVNRYKYSGNFRLDYAYTVNGEKDLPGYSLNKNYRINWTHTQDAKASPVNRFSASVNAGSSSFYQNYVTYNPANFLSNTFQSNISYSRIFPNKPFNLSVNARHSQNTLNNSMNLNLPDVVFNVNRIYPFKRKLQTGAAKWYEKIGIASSTNATNQVETYDSLLFKKETLQKMRNGMRNNLSLSTSYNLYYVTFSPQASGNFYSYLQNYRQFLETTGAINVDTIQKFSYAYDYNFSMSMSTKLFGMVTFRNKVFKAIRHVFSPVISYSWRPDFSEEKYGFYGDIQNTQGTTRRYSYFQQAILGGPGGGKSSMVNFNIDNNLELKVRDRNDTATGTRKIRLLESLSLVADYNIAADSMRLSLIRIGGRTTLIKQLAVNFNGTVNPYVIDSKGNVQNQYAWDAYKKIGQLTFANFSTSYTFNSTAFSSKKTAVRKGPEQPVTSVPAPMEEYVDFNIPWNFSFYYNINYQKNYSTSTTVTPFTQSLTFNGDLSLTPKWKLTASSGYDFVRKEFTYTSVNIYRDLHCWEMKFYWIPFGNYQSYNFQINVKSSVLQDLKLIRRRDWNQIE